jgi:hypothetical protein
MNMLASEHARCFLYGRMWLDYEPILRDAIERFTRATRPQEAAADKGVAAEMNRLTAAIKADDGYAWGWFCNLVMAFVDEGGDRVVAEKGVARFMSWLFEYDITKHSLYTPPAPQGEAADVEARKLGRAVYEAIGGRVWSVNTEWDVTKVCAAALTQAEQRGEQRGEQRSREEAKAKVEGAMCDECFARGEAVDWHPVCVTVFSILSKLSTPQTMNKE